MKSEREHIYFLDTPAGRKLDSTYEANEKNKAINDTNGFEEQDSIIPDIFKFNSGEFRKKYKEGLVNFLNTP
jgi:hypothetical protein